MYTLYRLPVENLGFDEYRSRAWTIYFANTQFETFCRFNGGFQPQPPSRYLRGLPAYHANTRFVLYTAGLISLIESHGLSPHLYTQTTRRCIRLLPACRCWRTLSVDLRVHGCCRQLDEVQQVTAKRRQNGSFVVTGRRQHPTPQRYTDDRRHS